GGEGQIGTTLAGYHVHATKAIEDEFELALSGVGVAHGYVWPPDCQDDRLRNGTFLSRDVVTRNDLGTLTYHRRSDSIVKVLGLQVDLAEVERVVRECPGVDAAAVVAIPDDTRGADLVAVVQLSAALARPMSASDVNAYARAHLDAPARPRVVLV